MTARRVATVALTAAAAVALAACSGDSKPAPPPVAPLPLATSVSTSGGTWAAIPMGHLDDPLNTFWQLMYRPDGATDWVDDVKATGTATNGGIVLAAGGASVTAAVRPSQLLAFSPTVSTGDGGRTWADGLVPAGLVAAPSALAAGPDGAALALVSDRDGSEVLGATGPSSWSDVTSAAALGRQPAAAGCALTGLDAVGYAGSDPLVGATCANPGVAGLFELAAGAWSRVPVTLPAGLSAGRTQVLAIGGGATGADGVAALLAVKAGSALDLVAAWDRGGSWSASSPLVMPAAAAPASVVLAADGTVVVLGGTGDTAAELSGAASVWRSLPAPPAGTRTFAEAGGTITALAGDGETFTSWALDPGAPVWAEQQTLTVPIQYGSSN